MSEKEIENKGSSLYQGRLLHRPLLSSTGLGWKGLVVERYQAPPCELPDLPIDHHIVELASQQHVSLGERPDWRGHLRPFSKYPGVCNCFPAGVRPKLPGGHRNFLHFWPVKFLHSAAAGRGMITRRRRVLQPVLR